MKKNMKVGIIAAAILLGAGTLVSAQSTNLGTIFQQGEESLWCGGPRGWGGCGQGNDGGYGQGNNGGYNNNGSGFSCH